MHKHGVNINHICRLFGRYHKYNSFNAGVETAFKLIGRHRGQSVVHWLTMSDSITSLWTEIIVP